MGMLSTWQVPWNAKPESAIDQAKDEAISADD